MNSIFDAQKDMRQAYYAGGTGAITSASVWLVAAIVATVVSAKTAVWTLFFGGMLIFPVSVLLDKLLGRSGKHAIDNPLGPLAMEGTIWMICGIVVAIGLSFYKIDWFFPAMLLIIGGRYLTFNTLFGLKIYWVFGIALIAAGTVIVWLELPILVGAYAGAGIEYVFGIVLLSKYK